MFPNQKVSKERFVRKVLETRFQRCHEAVNVNMERQWNMWSAIFSKGARESNQTPEGRMTPALLSLQSTRVLEPSLDAAFRP